MNDKSFVSIEQHQCIVCGTAFDTGNLLLKKDMRKTMERHTVTARGLCPQHEELYKQGYIALVEIDPAKSGIESNKERNIKIEDAYRTGKFLHIKRAAFAKIFPGFKSDSLQAMAFIEPAVFEYNASLQQSNN